MNPTPLSLEMPMRQLLADTAHIYTHNNTTPHHAMLGPPGGGLTWRIIIEDGAPVAGAGGNAHSPASDSDDCDVHMLRVLAQQNRPDVSKASIENQLLGLFNQLHAMPKSPIDNVRASRRDLAELRELEERRHKAAVRK